MNEKHAARLAAKLAEREIAATREIAQEVKEIVEGIEKERATLYNYTIAEIVLLQRRFNGAVYEQGRDLLRKVVDDGAEMHEIYQRMGI